MQHFPRLQLAQATQGRLLQPAQNLRLLAAKVVQICTYLQVKVLRQAQDTADLGLAMARQPRLQQLCAFRYWRCGHLCPLTLKDFDTSCVKLLLDSRSMRRCGRVANELSRAAQEHAFRTR
jgi:hypothetical protein